MKPRRDYVTEGFHVTDIWSSPFFLLLSRIKIPSGDKTYFIQLSFIFSDLASFSSWLNLSSPLSIETSHPYYIRVVFHYPYQFPSIPFEISPCSWLLFTIECRYRVGMFQKYEGEKKASTGGKPPLEANFVKPSGTQYPLFTPERLQGNFSIYFGLGENR